MKRGYIQGWWPCWVVAEGCGETRVLIEGKRGAWSFQSWLVEPRRRTL